MSANIEHALLTRVVQDGDFHTLDKLQINESFFLTPEAREIYRFLRDMYYDPSTRGLVPSLDMVRYRFTTFYPSVVLDSVPVLAAELRREKIRVEALQLAQNIMARADRDPMGALAELRGETMRLSALGDVSQDLSLSSAFVELEADYNLIANSGGMLGLPYPWQAVNDETQGMQPGQFLVLYGRPKSMKTWLGIYMMMFLYKYARARVLIYTREMSPKLMAWRAAAAFAAVDYRLFKQAKLQPQMKEYVFTLLRDMLDDEKMAGAHGHRQPYFLVVSDRGQGGGGINWLQSKIRDLQPDVVMVDGMYLMKDDRSGKRDIDWKQITHISQDLKLTAQEFNIPLLGITQANRAAEKGKGEDLTELAYADALGQDADAVFRVTKQMRVDEHGTKHSELWLNAPGMREGVFEGIVCHGQPATNFDFIRHITPADYDKSEKKDYGKEGQNGPSQERAGFKNGQYRDPRINFARG